MRFTLTAVLLLAAPISGPSRAAVILETAAPGPTPFGSGATALGSHQWMAARFSLDTRTRITRVGGHLRGAGTNDLNTLFAAVVTLDGPEAKPFLGTTTDPSAGIDLNDVVAHTVFDLPSYASTHVTLPLTMTIEPGDYALVFGSGLFGATGSGAMPGNNPARLDQLSLLGWWETFNIPSTGERLWQWNDQTDVFSGQTRRFVVEGFAVPELASSTAFALSALIIASARRRWQVLSSKSYA